MTASERVTFLRVLTYAVPWPYAERNVCERMDVALVLGQEAIRDEGLRVGPIVGVVMEGPDRNLHQVSRFEGQASAG